MGILLDILCIGLLAASAVVFAQKSVSSSLLSLGALLLALTAAFLLSLPLGAAGRPLIAPTVEKTAAYRLADLFFPLPHLATGRETVEALDFDELIRTNPPAFQKILDRYGADIGTLRGLPETHDSAAVLDAVTGRYSRTLSRAVSYAVLFCLAFPGRQAGPKAGGGRPGAPAAPAGSAAADSARPGPAGRPASGSFRWPFCWNGWRRWWAAIPWFFIGRYAEKRLFFIKFLIK